MCKKIKSLFNYINVPCLWCMGLVMMLGMAHFLIGRNGREALNFFISGIVFVAIHFVLNRKGAFSKDMQ